MSKDLDHFRAGYEVFRAKYFGLNQHLFDQLKQSQSPKTLMIACSDSRVDPALLLNAEPGDLFVVRNVANLVPPFEKDQGFHGTSAALDFAVRTLEVEHIIILGHSGCGGINSLFSDQHDRQGFIYRWMDLARPAYHQVMVEHVGRSLEDCVDLCAQEAIRHSLRNLRTFPWLQERVLEKKLYLHGWFFDLREGLILALDDENQTFKPL